MVIVTRRTKLTNEITTLFDPNRSSVHLTTYKYEVTFESNFLCSSKYSFTGLCMTGK